MSLSLIGSGVSETFTVRDSPGIDPQPIRIDAPDNKWILAESIESLSVDGAAGSDTVLVESLSSTSLESIGINGSDKLTSDGDTDHVFVEGTNGADELAVSAHDAVLQKIVHEKPQYGAAMVVDGLNYLVVAITNPEDSLQLDTFQGDDYVAVYGTTGGLQINTQVGDDVIDLFVDETGNTKFAAPVPMYQADVAVDAGTGVNKVGATSAASKLADTFEISDTRLSSEKFAVDYEGQNFTAVYVFGTKVNDSFSVRSTRQETNTLVRGGTGDDIVHVGEKGLDHIRGLLEIDGQSGENQITLDDRNTSSDNANVVIGANTVLGIAGADDTAAIEFANGLLEIFGSDDASLSEVFELSGSAQALQIHGGAGADTLIGDQFDNVWHVTENNGGSVFNGNIVSFDGIANLRGQSMNDYFVIHPGGQLSGDVDGAGGSNWLSYASFTTNVQVDLGQGTATATMGVSNVENVQGGAGDDVLLGSKNANSIDGGAGNDVLVGRGGDDTIFGGSGRDLLIGGTGSDSLYGGSGEDILIGSATTHDDHAESLNAIMSEWTRVDHKHKERVSHLTHGGGSNGSSDKRGTPKKPRRNECFFGDSDWAAWLPIDSSQVSGDSRHSRWANREMS
jgi:hypothetical protein